MTGGPSIIRKPGTDRSNLEFTNSLRSNFLAAQQDYSPPLSTNHSLENEDEVRGSRRLSVSAWTSRAGSDLYIPTIDWTLSGLAEERGQYSITVKLFYLPGSTVSNRYRYTQDAINLVLKELGVDYIDLLIVSFPGLSFDGECETEADRNNAVQGNNTEEVASWRYVEELFNKGTVKMLGLAEFGSEKLARFLPQVEVRPRVDQINVKDCCSVPKPLVELAEQMGVELLTHNDCTDILPSGTLRELLGQGVRGAGVLSDSKQGTDGMKGELVPEWVVKYTAVVRNRGVIENKGYFASADLRE